MVFNTYFKNHLDYKFSNPFKVHALEPNKEGKYELVTLEDNVQTVGEMRKVIENIQKRE